MNKWGKIILPKNNTLLYLLTILITVIATFAIYESNKYVLEKQIQKEFSYTSQKKAEEVKQWYESEKFAVSFFQQTTFFARGLKAYLNNPNDVKLKKQIIERLAASNKNEKYENIILTDSLGNVVLSLKNLSIRKTDSLITRGIQASIFNEKIHFQQLYDKGQATYKLFFIVPIGLPNEKPFATLIFSIDPRKELFDIVTKWPILDSTTHLHLISYEKNKYVLLNHYPQETIESFSVKTPTAEFIALQNKGKVIIGKDFYGKKVATLSIPIENTEWILLVKADYENLFAPLADRKRIFIWTALAIIVTISILFRLIQISQERFFYKQLLHKERVWNNQLKEYRTILYSIGDGVITTDRNGRITMMNAVAEQLTGYKEAEAINTPFAKVFNIANEYTLEPVETPIEKVIREKRVVGLANHTVLISRNGEKIPIVDSGAPVIDDLGNIQGVVLVFRDAREEKIREAKIREAERQYRTLFESIPNGVALHELVFNQENQPENYRILAVNHRYEEILQISRDQAIGKLATDLYSTPLPPYLDTYKQVAMSNLPVEFEAFFPQVNKYFHISVFSPEKNKFATVFQDITEKKLLETERYRLLNILESSLNEIYVFDFNDWHYEYVNQGGILNTGYSAKELKEKTPIDLLSNITKEEFEQFLLPVIEKKKKSIMLESFHRRKDGTQYPIEAHIQMHEEHNHKVFLAIVTDISEKKKYKQEVVSLEQKYTELFNSVTEAIFIHEIPSGTIVDVNEAVVKLYGYSSKKEVIEQCNIGTLSDFERGYTQERAEELIRKTIEEGPQHCEWLARRKNGEIFWIDIWLKKVRLGPNDYVIASGRDITHEKQIRLALDESNERFRLAFLTSPDSVNINRLSDGLYVEVNEGFCKITGYKKEEVIGKTSLELNIWANPEDRQRLVKELQEKGYCENLEAQFRCKDGRILTGLMSARVIMLKGVPHILNITRDITARKEMEKQLTEAKNKAEESDSLKTAFLHNISHEIRTPMNAIVGFSDLLRNNNLPPDRKAKYLDIIINSSKQLLSIVNDVLEISRLESRTVPVHLSSFNLNSMVEELYQLFLPRIRNLKFSYHCDLNKTDALAICDREKINQILTNLLNNAIKFTQEGSIEFGYKIMESEILWYVKDTGIGIPKEEQERVFERFYQANLQIAQLKGGSGLGLSIVKSLVEMLGGKIWLESSVGLGTTFYFTIPYNKATSQEPEHTGLSKTSFKSLNILIVEDNISNYDLVENLLSPQGASIEWAKTGTEAINMVNTSNYSLVLMDIKLPEMDGLTATRLIKKQYPHLPIIALTAFSTPEDQKQALEAGCDAFLTKPIDKKELFEIIQALSQSEFRL